MSSAARVQAHLQSPHSISPLERIVCGVDGSRSAYEAVRQAAELAGTTARLELVAVAYERGAGAGAEATLATPHARAALKRAIEIARDTGARPDARIAHGRIAAEVLSEESAGADLLVVASHDHTRIGGIMIGSTASRLVHTAGVPVLVARSLADGRHLLDRLLIAAGGPEGARAVEFATRLIVRHPTAAVTLLRIPGRTEPAAHLELARAAAGLQETLGVEPVELIRSGAVPRTIVGVAASQDASLVVVGSRGLRDGHALRSTSERVAHEAGCSVLVVRPRNDR